MDFKQKESYRKLLYIFIAVNIAEFILYYITDILAAGVPVLYDICLYTYLIVTQVISSLFPMVTATLMLVYSAHISVPKAFLKAVPYALTSMLCFFPNRAFYFAYQGVEFTGVMLFAAIYTVGYALIVYFKSSVLFLLMLFLTKLFAKKGKKYSLNDELFPSAATDFSKPITKSIFSASLVLFVYNLALEVFNNTIPYFENAYIYLAEELITMAASYVIILAILLICHFVSFKVKNSLSDSGK